MFRRAARGLRTRSGPCEHGRGGGCLPALGPVRAAAQTHGAVGRVHGWHRSQGSAALWIASVGGRVVIGDVGRSVRVVLPEPCDLPARSGCADEAANHSEEPVTGGAAPTYLVGADFGRQVRCVSGPVIAPEPCRPGCVSERSRDVVLPDTLKLLDGGKRTVRNSVCSSGRSWHVMPFV